MLPSETDMISLGSFKLRYDVATAKNVAMRRSPINRPLICNVLLYSGILI